MFRLLLKALLFLSLLWIYSYGYASNLIVSPIRYEIDAEPWESMVRTAFITNNSSEPILISAWKQDFVPSQDAGVPDFALSGNDHLNFSLQEWITYDEEAFILWPFEKKEVTIYIDIPEGASPGWHYGSVFFGKDDGTDTRRWNLVYVRVQYWILLLINVKWEVIEELHLNGVSVQDWSWTTLELPEDEIWEELETEDVLDNAGLKIICSLGNLIPDQYKWGYEDRYKEKCWDLSSAEDLENIGDEDFEIEFKIPFVNEWNTHVKPTWKVKLVDEDGTVTWEKIVDYIPINNLWGNILPGTSREFLSNCEWFTYKWYDEEGNEVIKYLTPGQYYTLKNQNERPFIMFWEKVLERVGNKKIKAIFDIEYKKLSGEVVSFNAAKEFNISYKEKYVGLNMYIIRIMLWVLFFIFVLYLIRLMRTEVCTNCKRRASKRLKVCPYCNKRKRLAKVSEPEVEKVPVKSKAPAKAVATKVATRKASTTKKAPAKTTKAKSTTKTTKAAKTTKTAKK